MNIELRKRTADHVRVYFERTQDPEIQQSLPGTVTSIQQALANFVATQNPNSTSYGCTIYVDRGYVGDVWCYGIDVAQIPQSMISYCIFDKCYWGKGVMSRALGLFLSEISNRYGISHIGAFSFSENTASIRVLEKNDFCVKDTFLENGVKSVYLQRG